MDVQCRHYDLWFTVDVPPLRGKEVDLCIFVDSNYAGNKKARRSRTRFVKYMNMSLINWYSKEQSTIAH